MLFTYELSVGSHENAVINAEGQRMQQKFLQKYVCTEISLFRIKTNLVLGFLKQNSVIPGYCRFFSWTIEG